MPKYCVATNIFEILTIGECQAWEKLAWHYAPFMVDEGDATLKIDVKTGLISEENHDGMTLVHSDQQPGSETLSIDIYKDTDGRYLFEITQPRDKACSAVLTMSADMTKGSIVINDDLSSTIPWNQMTSLTATIQLAYMLSNNSRSTILTHSSCILNGGRTYLFLGKSGTGKSTHSQLWLKCVPGSELMNDDHPIIHISDAGEVIAYGSPWSGKTHCYRNLQGRVGAIVRIKRAPYNAIRRLSVIEAYGSLIASFSGMTIDSQQADDRHHTIERIIKGAPCYELECRPDDEAAQVCSAEVLNI